MKTISATVLAALFAASSARFLDTTTSPVTAATAYGNPTYANTLKCGQCIGAGYTYCIQKQTEGTMFNSNSVTETCLNVNQQNANQWTSQDYSCSNMYADRSYAKNVCNFNTAVCGTNNVVQFTNANLTQNVQNVTVTGLQLGQTCFYTLKANCGAPAFQPEPTTANRFEFEYVQYQDGQINSTESAPVIGYNAAGHNSNSTAKRAAAPAVGVPRRDHTFNGELGGNWISNANQTVYNATSQGNIWGRSGRYDKEKLGRKVYGNPTQHALSLGNQTNVTTNVCTPRTLHLAVTATTDNSNTNITFSTVDFYVPPTVTPDTTGASFISMTFAAVLGLASLAFF